MNKSRYRQIYSLVLSGIIGLLSIILFFKEPPSANKDILLIIVGALVGSLASSSSYFFENNPNDYNKEDLQKALRNKIKKDLVDEYGDDQEA